MNDNLMNVDAIGTAALALPPDQRALLADLLLASLDPPPDIKYPEEWEKEIERRIDAYNRGEMKAYSREEVMKLLERDS